MNIKRINLAVQQTILCFMLAGSSSTNALPIDGACPFPIGGWSTQLQGTSKLDQANAVVTDWDICAIFIGGETWSSLAGQPFSGASDAYLTRYSTKGTVIWTRQIGGISYDSIHGVAVDSEHNVYATGSTHTTLPGSPTPAQGGRDIFLVKYDQDGNHQWTRQLGTAVNDTGNGIAISSSDAIYIVGSTEGLLPGAATFNGGTDFFIAKYDTAGNRLWLAEYGTAYDDSAASVAIGPSGNLYVVGTTDGTLSPADGHQGGNDLFVAKYDANGNLSWVHQRGSTGDELASAVAVNDDGQVFVAGATNSAFDGNVNYGDYDLVVLRYDTDGSWVWTDQRGTDGYDMALDIAVNSFGNPYTVGFTEGGLDGNGSAGDYDLFLMKHGRAGAWQWTRQYGTTASDVAYGIAVDAADNEYVVGGTNGNLGGQVNAGSTDAFAVMYDNNGRME